LPWRGRRESIASMPSWADIQEYARAHYTLSLDEGDSFSIRFELEGERSQQIAVRKFTAADCEWIEFRTYVCKEADLDPRDAVRKNAELPVGALALDANGDYYVGYAAQLATMDAEEFDVPLNLLVLFADALEEDHAGIDRH
jgi:hypothetical protein